MMKKAKKILLAFAFCLAFALAGAAVGCKGGEQDSSSSSSPTQEVQMGVRFSVSQVDIAQYESVNLDYKVKGTTSAVEFSSSDTAIATVDQNGRVTAKGVIGNAIIAATVDGVSTTCTVCVKRTTISPLLVLETTDYTLEMGESLQFNVAAAWNKEILNEDFACEAVVEDKQNVQSTVSANGKVITLVAANKAEEFSVIVSATVRGEYTSERITVRVEESGLKIRAVNTAFVPAKGGYAAQISTTDKLGDMANRISLDFAVGKGAQIFEDAQISWTLEGDCATLLENEIVGEKVGTVVLNGTATIDEETASVKVFCDVVAPEVHLEDTGVLEVENLQTITLNTTLIGEFINAELHGKEVSTFKSGQKISFRGNRDKFPRETRLLGEQELVLNTDKVRYTMDVTIYTMIINDADELDQMAALANTGATEICQAKNSPMYGKEVNSQYFDGYFVLGNDIDYNREFISMTNTLSVWQVTGTELDHTRGFKGIFDGMGYNIDGMTVGKHALKDENAAGGMFGFLPKEGIVRNVSFTNATVLANSGFICSLGDGTVENVSIQYKKIGGSKPSSNGAYGYRAMGSFFTYKCGPNATVKNCLIDASAADISYVRDTAKDGTFVYDVRLVGAAPHTSNVVVVSSNDDLLGFSGGDIQRNSYAEMRAESEDLFSKFDKTIWTVEQGLPMFVHQAKSIDVNKKIKFRESVDSVLVVGFDMPITVDDPYAQITIDEIEGVSLTKNVLSATNAAYGKTVTITATSLLNPDNTTTCTVYIDSFGEKTEAPIVEFPTVYDQNPVLVVGDNSWLWSENYLYYGKEVVGQGNAQTGGIVIDFAKFGYGTKNVTIVRDLDGKREYFTADITVWYVSADIRDSELVGDAFNTIRETTVCKFTDGVVDPDMETPSEQFESIARLDSDGKWSSAMSLGFFSVKPLEEYSDIWVSLKVENAYFIFQNEMLRTDEWVNFHFTQTSAGIWATEVTINGEVYKTVLNYDATGAAANQLAKLLYRSGIADGFLIYNKDAEVSEDTPTSVYATEIRGVKKSN